jgi:hypothetical protein
MRNWLHAQLTLRSPRALVFDPAHAVMSAEPVRAEAESAAELVGEVQRRNDAGAAAAGEASWLPPLWLSW